MAATPIRYRSDDEDSGRWRDFRFRQGDVVISTRSKSGTTWMQMICAMLVFGTHELPAPLPTISPWLDHEIEPIEDVLARLEAQGHRRIIKTHTPLDGIPLDPLATYIVVGRHPLDAAASLYHQGRNLDRARIAELQGRPPPPRADTAGRTRLDRWLTGWVEGESDPRRRMDSLPGFLHHLDDAWRRKDAPNVMLVHYEDLTADLRAEMAGVAAVLGGAGPLPDAPLDELVEAAGFEAMAERADELAPDALGLLLDRRAFFRRGRNGDGRRALPAADHDRYLTIASALAPDDVLAWLHRPSGAASQPV